MGIWSSVAPTGVEDSGLYIITEIGTKLRARLRARLRLMVRLRVRVKISGAVGSGAA